MPGTRKLITISLPPPLLKKAERIAEEENRTKSELVREALRFYVETCHIRKTAARERPSALIDKAQIRSSPMPSRGIRRLIRETIEAVRVQRASRS